MAENLQEEFQLGWQSQLGDLVTALAWAPQGQNWVASSAVGEVVWISRLGEIVTLQAATDRSIDCLGFSADGRWLAAGGQAGQLLVWDCQEIQLPPQLVRSIEIGNWIDLLQWHPTAPILAIGDRDRVQIWDAIAATWSISWKFDKSSIFDLAWHPNGESLAVAGYKGVQIWSPGGSSAPIHQLEVDTASIKIAWAGDGRYLVAGNLDRTLTVMDWQQPNDPWILQGCPGKIRQIDWMSGVQPPSFAVASGTEIACWKLTDDHNWAGHLLTGHQSIVQALTAHPHRAVLISGDPDGYACWWSASGEIEQILTNLVSGITTVGWHPQGDYLAIGRQGGEIELWSVPLIDISLSDCSPISINTDEGVTKI